MLPLALCFRKKPVFLKNNVQYVNMDDRDKSDSLLKALYNFPSH